MKGKKKIVVFALLVLFVFCGACTIGKASGDSENNVMSDTKKETDSEEKEEVTLVFTKSYREIKAGKSKQFQVNVNGVTWKSSNKKIATVNSKGKVKALRYGNVVIRATAGEQKVSVKVKVLPKKIIGIDPGHQLRADGSLEPNGPGSSVLKAKVTGGTHGVVTGKAESKLTLEVALKLKKALEEEGYRVILTRNKQNVNLSNAKRALKLNKKCNIAVRLHADGIENASVNGVSMQCSSSRNRYIGHLFRKCKKLSKKILSSYCAKTGRRNRGIAYRDDLTGTNYSTIPVTLIEMGFMTNASDDRYMASKDGQKAMVEGIVEGINQYFGY